MKHNLRILGIVFELQIKQMAVDLFFLFGLIVQPLLIALLAIYMLRDRGGQEYLIHAIIGSGMTGIWTVLLFGSAFHIQAERWMGTLENIVGSPTALEMVVVGKALANVAMSLASMVVCYALAALILGQPMIIARPVEFALSLLIAIPALLSFGLVIASALASSLSAGRWINALEFPMYILGGFLFPIALLPPWTTPLSYSLSPYWAAQALHLTSRGGFAWSELALNWTAMLVLSAIYLLISHRLFRIVLRRAREEATLGMY